MDKIKEIVLRVWREQISVTTGVAQIQALIEQETQEKLNEQIFELGQVAAEACDKRVGKEKAEILRFIELHNMRVETGFENGKRWFKHNDGIWLNNKNWRALKRMLKSKAREGE